MAKMLVFILGVLLFSYATALVSVHTSSSSHSRIGSLPASSRKTNNWLKSSTSEFVGESTEKPRVEIEYCPKCRWMLRSAYMAQELLITFEDYIGEVALKPSQKSGDPICILHNIRAYTYVPLGTFIIKAADKVVWDRRQPETTGFPEIKELKQRVRQVIAPDLDLGHSEKKTE
jgi:selenoprotein W-related protein